MIPFSFRQLEYFVAAAEHGSISAAARARHVSQPSVSTAIAQLEDSLGEPLFRRQVSRGLSLTPAGQRLLGKARDVLALAAGLAVDDGAGRGLSGQLSLTCFQDLGPYFVPRLLAGLRQRHPGISVTLFEADLATVHRTLQAGKAELAVTYELGLDARTGRRTLAELAPYALLPATHPLANSAEVSLADLAAERLILEDIPQTREYFLSLFWAHGLHPALHQYTQTFEMQRGLVAHGYGVALSCTRPAGDRSYDGVPIACRPLREPVTPQRVVLAHSPAMRASPLAQAFMDWVDAGEGVAAVQRG
ncbi:LysR family transcriptional regulator [Cupriavidus neocaledonicus]|uniref:Transcriptional regulator, lysR family n=1 Tax=Cupriavidus neocaledonicus TaxID=1040979 RepID=A0A375H5J9_9BURK|nr:LysR family transcriptional regulator [Cupriavidus neocaledonicus]SOZ36962.1 putative transcriptional regulator, lysR family [Cupriavidus neocaledonicus]SPD45537.1 DNA-binding transcriptional regulator, LysR family [Cupriavidus neocaledonicus]